MSYVKSAVVDGHYDVAPAGGLLPCGKKVDVAAGHGPRPRTLIAVVPLERKARVIEREEALLSYLLDIFDDFHPVDGAEVEGGSCQRQAFVKEDIVPQVESRLAVTLLERASVRESPHYAAVAYGRQINGSGSLCRCRFAVELHSDMSRNRGFRRQIPIYSRPRGRHRFEFLAGTGCKQGKSEGYCREDVLGAHLRIP